MQLNMSHPSVLADVLQTYEFALQLSPEATFRLAGDQGFESGHGGHRGLTSIFLGAECACGHKYDVVGGCLAPSLPEPTKM